MLSLASFLLQMHLSQTILPSETGVILEIKSIVKNTQWLQPDPGNSPHTHLFVPDCPFSGPPVGSCSSLQMQQFWWPTLDVNTRDYGAACALCIRGKACQWPPNSLLHPLPILSRPWSLIAFAYDSGHPNSSGNTIVLSAIDHFSKAVHFIALPKLPSSQKTANLLAEHVFHEIFSMNMFSMKCH